MTNPVALRIDGLRDLQKTLKDLDGESQKELRTTLNLAAEIVVKGAKRRAPVRSGALQKSIKVASSQREARVQEGSARVPYAGWIDFGGSTGRGHRPRTPNSGAIKRPFYADGRLVYPAYYAQQANITALLEKRLAQLITKHGLEVTGG